MMMKIRKHLNQKGFTLVELMVVIAILGILAAIAIPKFTDSTSAANTAKIAADLRTIDSAAVLYQAQTGAFPTADATGVTALKTSGYLVEVPVPPTGKCYMGYKDPEAVPGTAYQLNSDGRGILGTGNTAETFTKTTKIKTPAS